MREEEIIASTLADIPGYGGKYRANPQGQIVRACKNGKARLMTQYPSHKKHVVKLSIGGKSKEIHAAAIILLTFRGPRPPGTIPYHKNGIKSDNWLHNLDYITPVELGKKTGRRSGSRSVLKVNASGQAVAAYYSAREAGRRNHMSYQTVMDRCNGLVKKPYALDGCNYVWED